MPYVLLWLRYTGFIVLYPIGVSSELAMLWFALPTIKASAYPVHGARCPAVAAPAPEGMGMALCACHCCRALSQRGCMLGGCRYILVTVDIHICNANLQAMSSG